MYPFYSINFTPREIDSIVTLMETFSEGRIVPVKRTGLTKNVVAYALNFKLLEQRKDGKLYIPQSSGFCPLYDLPVEALWKMVQPMLRTEESTGYSIVNHVRWETLNIYPQKSRHASDKDLEEKTAILLKLSNYHYIHFQLAGSTWCIYQEAA